MASLAQTQELIDSLDERVKDLSEAVHELSQAATNLSHTDENAPEDQKRKDISAVAGA